MSRIRELREDAILTVSELSQISGVSETAITKAENGHRKRIRPSTLRALGKALGVDPRELRPSPASPDGSTNTLDWKEK
jgi:transcriptional regulator with XRE-family HTH domain